MAKKKKDQKGQCVNCSFMKDPYNLSPDGRSYILGVCRHESKHKRGSQLSILLSGCCEYFKPKK